MKLFILVARLLVGALFVGHGTQKLFGWFGGFGLEGTAGWLESLGLRSAGQKALAAGAAETAGGALLIAGFATPVATAALTGVMTTAIRTVHEPNGPWITNNGWEYTASVIALMAIIAEQGPGPVSLDHALGTERSGPGWGLASLIAGVGGAMLVLRDWERPQPAES